MCKDEDSQLLEDTSNKGPWCFSLCDINGDSFEEKIADAIAILGELGGGEHDWVGHELHAKAVRRTNEMTTPFVVLFMAKYNRINRDDVMHIRSTAKKEYKSYDSFFSLVLNHICHFLELIQ